MQRKASRDAVVVLLLCCISHAQTRTKVIILGVEHSAQLVSPSYQPAEFLALFKRIKPAAICIERDPENYGRGVFYEFTYEQQDLIVPFARARGIPIVPIDWIPSTEESMLAWGTPDITAPPFLRNATGFRGFTSFPEAGDLTRTLFSVELQQAQIQKLNGWYDSKRTPGRRDFPHRLELYRTFMQAMRIKSAARQFEGQTVLVVIGWMHKYDIENILSDEREIEIVQPSTFGQPADDEVQREVRTHDLAAIAVFNLLGVQASIGNIDWEWMDGVLGRLESIAPGPEAKLFRIRSSVLKNEFGPAEAIRRYRALLSQVGGLTTWTYTGVVDRSRVDSYFDPFGNLSFQQRVWLELARENHKLNNAVEERAWKTKLLDDPTLTAFMHAQVEGYWDLYVDQMK